MSFWDDPIGSIESSLKGTILDSTLKAGEYAWKNISGEYARQTAEEQKKVQQLQQRASDIAARKAAIAQQREARIRQTQILATSAGIVGEGTSGVAGAIGSIGSQLAQNISGITEQQDTSQQISKINQTLADISSQNAQGGMVAQLAINAATAWAGTKGGSPKSPTTIFGGGIYQAAGEETPFSLGTSGKKSSFGFHYFRK